MPIEKTITLYKFDELSDRAKDKAREWFRGVALDHDWWDSVYEDAARMGELIGVDLRQRPVKTMGGQIRHEPDIRFSGFASQGDGACWQGTYTYKKGAARAVTKETGGTDAELTRIATELQAIQRKNFYRLTASVATSGRYEHSGTMQVNVERTDDADVSEDAEETVTQLLRDFADWIYRNLEKEYDYQMSDEQIDESIKCNDYTFRDTGERED